MPKVKKSPNILSKPSKAIKAIFIGKGSYSLQTNTSKPQKKHIWEKLEEISKLLFAITSSKQELGLGSTRDPIFRFF